MTMKKRKPIKGETLYRLNIGNAARFRRQELTPVQVIKVGRKYFECIGASVSTKHCIDTWHHETGGYMASYALYEEEQEWEDERERNQLLQALRETFRELRNPGITLPALRQIKQIIDAERGQST